MPTNFYVDFHCHSTLKPYGRSYPNNHNSPDPNKKSSIWYSETPKLWAKIKNVILTLTQFTQSDFSTLAQGNVRIIGASLSPLEKGFFVSRFGDSKTVDTGADIVTGIGKAKVEFIQNNFNYFSELMNEYNFLKELNEQLVNIGGVGHRYILVNRFEQIEAQISDQTVLLVVPSIEGSHAFCENNNQRSEEEQILANVMKVKELEYPPFYISITHHFYNELAGHAYSLNDGLQKIINQDFGANTSITGLGLKLIKLLLDNSQGSRILIDIKHMSRLARRQYYALLQLPEYELEKIPIIVSHGAVNGRPTVYSNDFDNPDNGQFYGGDINIYDDELILIAKTQGIFGLQFDERRTVGKSQLKKIRFKLSRKKMLNTQSELLWNQIEYIAAVLDNAGYKSWDILCIGSDFDGMANPLNGFWTAKEFSLLSEYLLKHAQTFLSSSKNELSELNRNISPEEIVQKIFSKNALEFLQRNLP
jgi:microsomal dipeptidase-like Zn-dependent dipeptidase